MQKRSIKNEYKLYVKNFEKSFIKMLEDGHVPDSEFQRLQFPMDMNKHGKIVPRSANIVQESRQRAKIMTHDNQVMLIQHRMFDQEGNRNRTIEMKKDKLRSRLDENQNVSK